MVTLIKITLIALILSFPFLYWVKKARIDFSVGYSWMFGVAINTIEVQLGKIIVDKWHVCFSFGPLQVTGTWIVKVSEDA